MTDRHSVSTGSTQVVGCCTVFGELVRVAVYDRCAVAALGEDGRAALVAELAALWAQVGTGRTRGADAG